MRSKALARNIGADVRARRLDLALTQRQLAAQAGVSERLLRSLEAGEAVGIGLDKLSAVLDAAGLELGVSDKDNASSAARAVTQDEEYSILLKETVASWGGGGVRA